MISKSLESEELPENINLLKELRNFDWKTVESEGKSTIR